MRGNSPFYITIAAAALWVLSPDSQAALIYSTGFEAPTYTQGVLGGQDGWTGFGNVQSATVASGSQALLLHTDGSLFAFSNRLLSTPTSGQIITIEVDLRIHHRAQENGVAVLRVFGDTGTIGRFGYINGYYRFGNMSINIFGDSSPPDDTWHHFVFEMNFPMQTISATLNGTSLGTLPIINPVMPSTLTNFQMTVDQSSAPLDGYFDNISISSIPEPASLALLGCTAPIVFRRRLH